MSMRYEDQRRTPERSRVKARASPPALQRAINQHGRRVPVRRFIAGAVVGTLLVACWVGPALAAGPDHETIRGSDVDSDFCGTGQTVDVTVEGVFNGWEDKAFGHIRTTYTNPTNGIAIYDSFSGGGKVSIIDDGDGAYTIVASREGQPFRVQYVNGPVIVHDAGLITSYSHFDADDNLLGVDVVASGPHPGFALDWCALMVDLLQL
jgi:hypothetical protein